MTATPAQLVAAQDELIDQGVQEQLGAFPIGPVYGDDVLPQHPVEAMRRGAAHPVPLIVGTNAEEGRLFTRFLQMLPTNETMIEDLFTHVAPATRRRILEAYPDYPAATRASVSVVISRSAPPVGRSPRRTAPTLPPTPTATTSRPARCAGPDWAPPTPPNCSPCSTSTAAGWA